MPRPSTILALRTQGRALHRRISDRFAAKERIYEATVINARAVQVGQVIYPAEGVDAYRTGDVISVKNIGRPGNARFVPAEITGSTSGGATGTTTGDTYTKSQIDAFLGAQDEFVELEDTPSSYTGFGGKLVAVKMDETGLEFVDPPSSSSALWMEPMTNGDPSSPELVFADGDVVMVSWYI